MKKVVIYVEACKDCPHAEDHPGARRIKHCTLLDNWVKGDEIDSECPLEDACKTIPNAL